MIPFPADDVPVYEICSAIAFQERLLERDTQILEDRWDKLVVRVDKHNTRQINNNKDVAEVKAKGRVILVSNPVVLHAESEILEFNFHALSAEHEALKLADKALNARRKALVKKKTIVDSLLPYSRVLESLIRHSGHLFRQADILNMSGHCSAYGVEYAHWRRAGLRVEESLSQLTRSTAQARLKQTQQEIQRYYFSCMTRTFSSAPQSRAIQAYVHSYEAHYDRMRHDLTFSGRRPGGMIPSPMVGKESKLSRAQIPDLKLATRSALSVHGSIAIKFSFAMLPFIWPANVFRPWIQAESQAASEKFEGDRRFADLDLPTPPLEMKNSPQLAHPASPVGKPPSLVGKDKKGHAKAGRQALHLQKVVRQYEAWRLSLKSQLDAIFKCGPPSGFILCFIDIPFFWGHFVVIDLMADPPGIFDPNYGFFSLRSKALDDQFFHWMLALLVAQYDVQRIDFMHVPG